jgi:hypothetical protein
LLGVLAVLVVIGLVMTTLMQSSTAAISSLTRMKKNGGACGR